MGLQILCLPAWQPLFCGLSSKNASKVSSVVTILERRKYNIYIFKISRATYGKYIIKRNVWLSRHL